MAKVISFINYKGGVGKTTTTYHVGCSLAAHHGKRVLLVDIDPQTNLTFLAVEYEDWERFKRNNGTVATLYERYQQGLPLQTQQYIWEEPIGHDRAAKIHDLDIIPCDLELLGEDIASAVPPALSQASGNPFRVVQKRAQDSLREWLFLKEAFAEIQDSYDYVLIDCPPNIYMMTQNALVASDYYVIPTIPEFLSTIGIRILNDKLEVIRQSFSSVANMAGASDTAVAAFGGIVLVKVRIGGNRVTRQHFGRMVEMQGDFPDECFADYTTELIGYSEAAQLRLPIWLANTPNARKAARKLEYENITNEILRRFP